MEMQSSQAGFGWVWRRTCRVAAVLWRSLQALQLMSNVHGGSYSHSGQTQAHAKSQARDVKQCKLQCWFLPPSLPLH